MTALDDVARLRAAARSGLGDGGERVSHTTAARMVARMLGVPVAHTTLVLSEEQLFVGQVGLPEEVAAAGRVPLAYSFCQHVVRSDAPFAVSNTTEEPLLRDNLSVRDHRVAAYLGVPLRDADGHTVGTLCALDFRPRTWTPEDLAAVTDVVEFLHRELVLESDIRQLREEREGPKTAEAS